MGKMVTAICIRCGKEFQANAWRQANPRYVTKTCSKKCGTRFHGTAEERFWKKTEKRPNGCWEWIGCVNNSGYPTFSDKGKVNKGHRWAYEHWVGPIPEGKILMHSCDNNRCVNPKHLRPGTNKENSEEAKARGRLSNVGGHLPKAKHKALITLIRSDMPKDQIAKALGISRKTVHRHALASTQQATQDDG